MHHRFKSILAGLLVSAATAAGANVVIDGGGTFGVGPINTAFSGSGSTTQGGQTLTFTGAAGSAGVSAVYFGLSSAGNSGFSGDNSTITGGEIYHWHADSGNTIEYRGQTTVPTVTGNPYTLFTRLLLTAVSGAVVVTDPVTQGLVGGVHSVMQLTGGTFVVTREVELSQDGINWSDARPTYDGLAMKVPGSSFQNSVGTAFYWQNQAQTNGNLPEPGTLLLVAASLAGLSLVRRKGVAKS